MKKNLIVTGGIFHPFEETSNSLSNILSDKVIFKLSQPNRAGLVLPEDIEDDEDLTMLVMPVMLND